MLKKSVSLFLFISFLAVALVGAAGVPQLINYQGRMTNTAGMALDTTVEMTFTIYDDSTGGNPKWTETHSSVTVTGGFFNILLGGVNLIPDTVFNETLRYLGTTVGTNPELSPRTQLISIPYAYRSTHADTATISLSGPLGQGGWADDGTVVRLTTGNDNVGIGTASPSEKLDVDGNIISTGTISSGGSLILDGSSDMITASGGTIDFDDDALVTTGYVGIGEYPSLTTETRLEIRGTADTATSLIGIYHETSAPWHLLYPVFEVYNESYAYTPITIVGGGGIIQRNTSGGKSRASGNIVNVIAQESSYFNGGNVGFGTDSPETKIDLRGPGQPDLPLLLITQQAGSTEELTYPVFEIRNELYGHRPLTVSGSGIISMSRSDAAVSTMLSPDKCYFNGGNVGIGTEDPRRPLHVTEVMRLEPSPVPPPDPQPGDMFIDASDSNRLKVFDGAVWQACWQTGG